MPESAKEGKRGLAEGLDTGLGPRDRGFKSRSPDQTRQFSVRKLAGLSLLEPISSSKISHLHTGVSPCH